MIRNYDYPELLRMDTIVRLNQINKQLTIALAKLGITFEQALKAFRDLAKIGATQRKR